MPRPAQPKDLRLIHKVSHLYYEQNLSGGEIAEKLNLSLAKVSRVLSTARQIGMVQIIVNSPQGIYPQLEEGLEKKYHIQEAIVTGVDDDHSPEAVTRAVGRAAADYFLSNLKDGSLVGVSWGNTLGAMVASLQPQHSPDSHVVQIIGGLGSPTADAHVTDLCRRLSGALGCGTTLLPAPGIVGSRQAKEILLSDPYVQKAFDLIPQIDVALVGIGPQPPNSTLLRDGTIITRPELEDLLKRGAVGDIALRFFDRDGRPVQSEIDERVIGITLSQLKNIKRVVGVAGGIEKLAAIRGALLGGYLDVLVVDQPTAEKLIGDEK